MILFRSVDGEMFQREPQCNYYTDVNGNKHYIGPDETPFGIEGKIVDKFWYTPEEYLAAFPEGKVYHDFVDRRDSMFVQTYLNCSCLSGSAGNMYVVWYEAQGQNGRWKWPDRISIWDGDDYNWDRKFDSKESAMIAWEELKSLAPFHPSELESFGYHLH